MQDRDPSVYISVLNWNGGLNIIKCLNSLMHLEYENAKILVVDNSSADESVQLIQTTFPDLDIISSHVNRGYAGGHQLALGRAISDNVELFWMVNNDLTVKPSALTELVTAYVRRGDCLYGSLTLKASDESRVSFGGGWEIGRDGKPDYTNYNRFSGQIYGDGFRHMEERVVADLSGSSFMIPMAVVKQHGFMDECFFLYGEETDYCLRLGKKGIPSVIVPSSVVIHDGKGTAKARPELVAVIEYYNKRNWLFLVKRHQGTVRYLKAMLRELQACLTLWRGSYLRLRKPPLLPTMAKYRILAVLDTLRCRRGKTFAPEDFLL